MRRWPWAGATAYGALFVLLSCHAVLAAPCDEYNPAGPWRSAQITLGPNDFVDEAGDEMRSFVATGSVGRVEAAIVSATPPGIVAGLSAVPKASRLSPDHGETLKGIAVAVRLAHTGRPARVVVALRQVCARYFRNTFLYY